MRFKVFALLLMFAFCFTGQPTESQAPILIYVNVGGRPDDNTGEITAKLLQSYVERGLQESGENIKVSDWVGSSYQLRISFLEHIRNNQVRTGDMSISYVLTKTDTRCECYVGFWILVWERSNMREAADLIVADVERVINP